MSRIVGFDLHGTSLGEVHANCNRGWAINDGSETRLRLGEEQLKPWLEFGRTVIIEHPKLPAWAGMIDTPWDAVLPIEITLYPVNYLLAIRTPDAPQELKGTAGEIALQMIDIANAQEDLLIRAGEIDMDDTSRVETLDQRTLWEQLTALAKRAGMEMRIRPERDANNRLVLYFDMKKRLGIQTGFLLHDGKRPNIEILKATIEREIWNRLIGIGDQSSLTSRLVTAPLVNAESSLRYRLRSKVVQYQGVIATSTLEQNTLIELNQRSRAWLSITVNALDIGDTFAYLDIGNSLLLKSSEVRLPGGERGWNGLVRIAGMEYSEDANTVGMVLEAPV